MMWKSSSADVPTFQEARESWYWCDSVQGASVSGCRGTRVAVCDGVGEKYRMVETFNFSSIIVTVSLSESSYRPCNKHKWPFLGPRTSQIRGYVFVRQKHLDINPLLYC